jgi:hypothetical protein
MEIVAQKFRSFAEEEQAERKYYRSLTPNQRLAIAFALQQSQMDETTARLERVYRIVKLHEDSPPNKEATGRDQDRVDVKKIQKK